MEKQITERVLNILEWPLIEKELKGRCKTEPGKSLVGNHIPLNINEITAQLDKITDLKNLMLLNEYINFTGISNISDFLIRSEKNSILHLEELLEIKKFTSASKDIKNFLKTHLEEYKAIGEENTHLDELKDITKRLNESITDEGELNAKKFPILRKLRDSHNSAKRDSEKILNKMIHSPANEKTLQEKIYTTINQRYVLLVKSGMKNKINGTIHDVSSTGATFYIEPDSVKDLNNKIISLHIELQNEINRILRELSQEVANNSDLLSNNLETISYIDYINGAAKFSIDIKGNSPEIIDKPEIKLINARHPMLQLLLKETIVANDITLGTDYNSLIISGANTGGKTVLLKTIGLAVLLTMYGLHLPVDPDSQIGLFSNIFADIGDDQNLQESLSTFSGQIEIINSMILNANKNSLILIDEIMAGTNPAQGAALAQAILEKLAEKECKIIVTTHYTELKELASRDKRFLNASVSFDLDSLQPTYKLLTGLPGVSFAVEIARNYNMNESILSRTTELLSTREMTVEALLEETRKFKQSIEEEKNSIKEEQNRIKHKEEKLQKKEFHLNQVKKDLTNEKGLSFLNELKEHRKKIANRITSLQHSSIQDAGEIQKEIIGIQDEVFKKIQKEKLSAHESTIYLSPENAASGQTVYIPSIEKNGIIESIDNSREWATVMLGKSFRTRIKISELMPVSNNSITKKKESKKTNILESAITSEKSVPLTIQTSYNTIDLRGKRVDEALIFMNENLDTMAISGINCCVIIHGHGTGALKSAIRENLKMSIYVNDFRPGEQGEGSDGVTIAMINRR